MSATTTEAASVWEDGDVVLMARVTNTSATNITQATISSGVVKVYDKTGAQVGSDITLVVANTIFDSLQTDNGWPFSTGYNFRTTITGATYFGSVGTHCVEVLLTPSSGSDIAIVYDITVQNLKSK